MIGIILKSVYDYISNTFGNNMYKDMGFDLKDVVKVVYVKYNRSNKKQEYNIDLGDIIDKLSVYENCNREYQVYIYNGGSIMKLFLRDGSYKVISFSNDGTYVGYNCGASTFSYWYYVDNNPLAEYSTDYE